MSKVKITVASGVAAVYPFGQQGAHETLKEDQVIHLEIKERAEPKGNLPGRVAEDMEAPAIGVATDEPFGKREGSVAICAISGAVTVRTYEGSAFVEHVLAENGTVEIDMTESNKITASLYPAQATEK